jgi:hypothetical protein
MILAGIILIISAFLIIVMINLNSINRIRLENKYSNNNGRLLMYGMASTFQAWSNNSVDNSKEFLISKECFDRLDLYDSQHSNDNLIEASKNNLILDKRWINLGERRGFINQCIILKDVKILYLTYNTLFPNAKEIFQTSLKDDRGNIIAASPSFNNVTSSLMLENYENYFWGVDLDLYDKIVLNFRISSPDGALISYYDQVIYERGKTD